MNIFKSLTLLSRNSSWAVTQAEILWSPAVSSSLTKIDHENILWDRAGIGKYLGREAVIVIGFHVGKRGK